MRVDREPGERDVEHELRLDIDAGRPLAELTVSIDGVCRRAEDGATVLVLCLENMPPGARVWPGRVSIQEVNRWERALRRLERLSSVTIAVAHGTCGGPALDLWLAADYRIGSADLRMMLPVNDGHFWPGMALHRLVNEIGVARARRLVLWGHEITAERAEALGLVDEIAGELEEAVRAAALLLGQEAGADYALRRQLLLEAPAASYEEALGAHLAACDRDLRRQLTTADGNDR
ncbi:MAG TPA: enoyl-CoA-hydratase DpgB [Actinophytocola sp.]|uniref:enoyl-CoA-hydratase DpgB n=1 Tax=Actinophytocola sp. TaxID=1872138 RepID=UPI002F94DB00